MSGVGETRDFQRANGVIANLQKSTRMNKHNTAYKGKLPAIREDLSLPGKLKEANYTTPSKAYSGRSQVRQTTAEVSNFDPMRLGPLRLSTEPREYNNTSGKKT